MYSSFIDQFGKNETAILGNQSHMWGSEDISQKRQPGEMLVITFSKFRVARNLSWNNCLAENREG